MNVWQEITKQKSAPFIKMGYFDMQNAGEFGRYVHQYPKEYHLPEIKEVMNEQGYRNVLKWMLENGHINLVTFITKLSEL